MAQPRNVKPHKLTEPDHRVLKQVAHKNHLSSDATLTTEFQTASGSNVSTRPVRWELHKIGFHGRDAAHRPKITMHNPKRRLECWSGVKLTAVGLWSSEKVVEE